MKRLRDARGCMVCGIDNETGMNLEFIPAGEDGARVTGCIPVNFEGFDGVAHGGAVAAVLDDAMWWSIYHATGADTMTAELTARYRKPVPVGSELTVHGRLDETRGRLYRTSAYICDGDEELARAQGTFLVPKKEV